MITTKGDYEPDDDRNRVDTDVVWGFMSEEAYWARWRERSDVEEQVAVAWPGVKFRWMLHTSDAHGLYGQFGFGVPDGNYLERPSQR